VKSKVLIIGASGFIGARLWERRTALGDDVVACVTSEPPSWAPLSGRRHPLRLPEGDIGRILAEERPDHVVHCAGSSSVADSIRDPAADFEENVTVTEHLMRAVAACSPRSKVTFLSSAAVYGDPALQPIDERALPAPISPHGVHKLMAETACRRIHDREGVPLAVLRIFSGYGPGLRKRLLWDIYQQWLRSGTVSLYGSGEETRDFIYGDDIVEAIGVVMEAAPFRGEVFNVASGRETSVRTAARLLLEALGGGKELEFTAQVRAGDPRRWQADVGAIRALGVPPGVAIEEGIQRYAKWLRAGAR
jgi:nucleoside-diphosphate-sugar epimerase